jgi:hypothetical protein
MDLLLNLFSGIILRMLSSAPAILGSLLTIPVLAFLLGILAAALRADLRLPDAAYQAISIYLLLAIGIKGGVSLSESNPQEVIAPLGAAITLGILIPVTAFWILRGITRLGPIDRGAMAAHYGSTSLVTFTACLVFLDAAGIAYEGFMATILTVLEVPGIIAGVFLASRAGGQHASWRPALSEVLTSKSILLLAGGLAIGLLAGPAGYVSVQPFFGALFTGVLALFLLHLGTMTGKRLRDVRSAGPGLIAFAIGFPVIAGAAGVVAGTLTGLSPGGATVLGVLCASASYIAAPAAVRIALPDANLGLCLTSSLCLTFPFNLILGIPLYLAMATALTTIT